MRPRSALQERQCEGMNVTCNQGLVELWADMRAASHPGMANTTYTCLLARWPLPTIMCRDSSPQERQFTPMDVTCNQDLMELWVEMLVPPPTPDGHHTLYLSHLAPAFTDDYAAG
jgi:hypothetical protein